MKSIFKLSYNIKNYSSALKKLKYKIDDINTMHKKVEKFLTPNNNQKQIYLNGK